MCIRDSPQGQGPVSIRSIGRYEAWSSADPFSKRPQSQARSGMYTTGYIRCVFTSVVLAGDWSPCDCAREGRGTAMPWVAPQMFPALPTLIPNPRLLILDLRGGRSQNIKNVLELRRGERLEYSAVCALDMSFILLTSCLRRAHAVQT